MCSLLFNTKYNPLTTKIRGWEKYYLFQYITLLQKAASLPYKQSQSYILNTKFLRVHISFGLTV